MEKLFMKLSSVTMVKNRSNW